MFSDPDRALQFIRQLEGQLSRSLIGSLPSLLRDSPDPDSSLSYLERMVTSYPREVLREFERVPALLHYAIVVFGHSRYLSETLMQNPDLLPALLRRSCLDRSYSLDEIHENLARFLARSMSDDISLLLARFKRREYVRIMLRDVLKIAPLAETTSEISALSDVLIETALGEAERRLHNRFGLPHHADRRGRLAMTHFSVLALGKLGGNELNYSSDVDLIFVYGDGADVPGARVTSGEYFVRMAQELTAILSQVTAEGPVFRLDLRLRPQGNEGELAISLSRALQYYAEGAADWERQALTKVRCVAGDPSLAREFIRGVQSYVYTAQPNFEAIETAQESRQKMHLRKQNAARSEVDVKVSAGGIRDIEFLVQCLQRVYGGAEPWLRSASTMSCLQKLCDKQHLSSAEFGELNSAYEFLRHVEHRLQLRYGQQTHRLPPSENEMRILQRAVAPFLSSEARNDGFDLLIRSHMQSVLDICGRVIARQHASREREASAFELKGEAVRPWDASQRDILHRLANDAPEIYALATRGDLSASTRKNLVLFLSSAMSTSERYGILLQEASSISKLLPVFESSEYLSEALVHHPEQIVTIAALEPGPRTPAAGYLFDNTALLASSPGDPVFAYVADANLPYPEKMAMLRRHYWHRTLLSVARDVLESRPVYESLAEMTGAAEEGVRAAFAIAGAPSHLAVMALGRMGTGEFDLLSDADLIFVTDENSDYSQQRKFAERIVQILAAYTQDGSVFPVDTRLRPRGRQGDLLISVTQLRKYFETEAEPWEALVYTKLRFIAGSRVLGDAAVHAAQSLFEKFQDAPGFRGAIHEMRMKLQSAEPESFKTGSGGVYDIDFLVSRLMIEGAVPEKNGTLRDRLWRLAGKGVLPKTAIAILDHAAEFLRTAEHMTRVVTGRQLKSLPVAEHALQMVGKLTQHCLGRVAAMDLRTEFESTTAKVRELYDQFL